MTPKRGTKEWNDQLIEMLNFTAAQPDFFRKGDTSISDCLVVFVFAGTYAPDAICVAEKKLGALSKDPAYRKLYLDVQHSGVDGGILTSDAIQTLEHYINSKYGEPVKE